MRSTQRIDFAKGEERIPKEIASQGVWPVKGKRKNARTDIESSNTADPCCGGGSPGRE